MVRMLGFGPTPVTRPSVPNAAPSYAVDASLLFANAFTQCAPTSSAFRYTAPRCADATNVDSIARGPGYGCHAGRSWFALPAIDPPPAGIIPNDEPSGRP